MSTHERLQMHCAMPEMKWWDEVRWFNVTRKGSARCLRAYIVVSPQTHCNSSSSLVVDCH